MKMKNALFSVGISPVDGGLESLVLNSDPDRMNWIEGLGTWGVPLDFEFKGLEMLEKSAVAHYRRETLELEVVRSMENDFLRERFTFRNTGSYDLYFQRGGLGIFATFNDSYPDSATCVVKRCHAHIWCGGENSWIHALKMGPFPTELALILTRGSLDSYSVRRVEKEMSNDRGDFVLHPSPLHLLPGESTVLEWDIAAFGEGHFTETLLAHGGVSISFDQETVFQGETFRIEAEEKCFSGKAAVFLAGAEIPHTVENGKIHVEYKPGKTGEYRFDFMLGKKRFQVRGLCVEDFDKLLEKRVRFIIRKHQVTDPATPLYGAFLIYDNEEQTQYFSYKNRDHNACRERGNMGLLICRYLQMHPDDMEAARALDLYEKFLLREIYDTETGEVHDNIGKHSIVKRLYNAAGLINFWQEMYRLRGSRTYLEWIVRSIRLFYKGDGYRFYPNGTLFSDAVDMIRAGGLIHEADELSFMVRSHVEQICSIGIAYPAHEVRFEQTIATPAVAILSAFYDRIDHLPAVRSEAEKHVRLLDRFQGSQPDYHLHEIPIRHWDGFWFGKRALYGDTLPHYLSALSARAFLLYAKISDDCIFRAKAKRCFRNCLCLFSPDGSASSAYLYPFSVTMLNPDGSVFSPARRGEYYDPWANDQDGALYLILQSGGKKALL